MGREILKKNGRVMITLYYASVEFLLCVGINEVNGRISSCLPRDEYFVRIYFYMYI